MRADRKANDVWEDAAERVVRRLKGSELLGLTYREAAIVLDVPEGTVKSRVFQARFVPGEEGRSLRPYSFASATIVLTDAVVPPPTSTSTMKVPVSRIGSSRRRPSR